MLVVVQIPVIDLSRLQEDAVSPIRAPRWRKPRLAPISQRDFVRGVGAVVPRKTHAPWQADGYYVDASRSLRFESGLTERGLIPIFRRLFREDLLYRLELGFTPTYALRAEAEGRPWYLAEAALRTGVRFASSPAPSQTLAQFGPDLADHLGSAVFRTSTKPVTGGHGFIDGAPAVVLESRGANQLDRPSYQQEWLDIAGVRVSGWLFEKSSRYPSGGQTRLLRLHIARIHADMALAEAVLAACEDGSLDESSELVLRCLHRVALRLGRRESHGFPQRDLVRQVADGAREHYAGQVDTIVRLQEQLDSAPGNRHLLRLAEHYSGGTLIYYEGDLVAGDKYKITTKGDGNVVTTGKDNQVHVETVTTTTNEPQLTDLIAELMQEVARLSAELGDDATNAEDAANGLSREAAEPQPDAGRMSRRLERLREIAAKLGDAGLKVIDIVSKISQLIPG